MFKLKQQELQSYLNSNTNLLLSVIFLSFFINLSSLALSEIPYLWLKFIIVVPLSLILSCILMYIAFVNTHQKSIITTDIYEGDPSDAFK